MAQGDHQPADFVRLLLAHQRPLLQYLVTLLPNLADAEDVLQEVGIVLWEKFDQYEPGTNFAAWAFRIAYLKVLEFRKKQRRQPQLFSDELLELIQQTAIQMNEEGESLQHVILERCLSQLPPQLRKLIETRYQPRVTLASTASQIGRSVVTARKMLRQAHQLLLDCSQRQAAQEDS